MARLRAGRARPGVPRGRLAWLTRTRVVRVSPLAALALAASVGGVVVLARSRPAVAPAVGRSVDAADAGRVHLAARSAREATPFTLAAPTARSVSLVGDFNDWDPGAVPLQRAPDGRWQALVALAPGRYEYAFVVDGSRIVADPAAPQAVSDYGSPNSVVTVDVAAP